MRLRLLILSFLDLSRRESLYCLIWVNIFFNFYGNMFKAESLQNFVVVKFVCLVYDLTQSYIAGVIARIYLE